MMTVRNGHGREGISIAAGPGLILSPVASNPAQESVPLRRVAPGEWSPALPSRAIRLGGRHTLGAMSDIKAIISLR